MEARRTTHLHLLLAISFILMWGAAAPPAQAESKKKAFTDTFQIETCSFSDTGSNPYFILEPGFQSVLEGEEDREDVILTVTVLNDTEVIEGVTTRVVEERETHDGVLEEVSLNFFAICDRTNSVWYFGEDTFDGEGNLDADDSWRAGVNGARPGVFMPGDLLLGARFFQEIAPGVALDRVEILSISMTAETPAGSFSDVLMWMETTPLEPGEKDFKLFAPGIGITQDGTLILTEVKHLW